MGKTLFLPPKVEAWLKAHGAKDWVIESAPWPETGGPRTYVLATVALQGLDFVDTTYNPRKPNPPKVKELQASVRLISLLSPLTCAHDLGNEKEPVVLIDGRHRYEALKLLAEEDRAWEAKARVDAKVFFGLTKSDLHVLATYLNRTRRALKRGEYYTAIVNIFEQKKLEVEQETGRSPPEDVVFNSILKRQLQDRDFDLSIGRIVGVCALSEEEGDSWSPYVGSHQGDRFRTDGKNLYCPLTAGNLAEFLRHLCLPKPYKDQGQNRAVEIGNTLDLGRIFRKTVFGLPTDTREEATYTTVGCKFWCMAALGSLMGKWKELPAMEKKSSPFSHAEIPWTKVKAFLSTYVEIMKPQAAHINKFRNTSNQDDLRAAWSYQTQQNQVLRPLRTAFEKAGYKFRGDEDGKD
jgi:hypothetical protein